MKKPLLRAAIVLFASSRILLSDPLRVNGSTTVNAVAAEAAEILRAEKRMEITVDTQGGSSGGISGLGEKRIDIGMSSKSITDDDQRKFPGVVFVETKVGEDAVALVVSSDVWKGGVRALTKEQARGIYEGKIANWKAVGGPNRRVVFFNKEPGRGTWEVFARWLYGDPKNAPDVDHPEVGANSEALSKVSSSPGAVTQLSAAWAQKSGRAFALALITEKGIVSATAGNIASGRYPLSRPLFLLTDGKPEGEAKVFVDFVLSQRGQEIVRKQGYLRLRDLTSAKP